MRYVLAAAAVIIIALSFSSTYAQPTGSASVRVQSGANSSTQENNFYSSLTQLYTLGLSLVGISALFMIIWGGAEYIVSGESSSRVGQAKDRIKNALWGIAIAAVSYTILYTINPDLVKLRIGTPADYQQQNFSPSIGNSGTQNNVGGAQ